MSIETGGPAFPSEGGHKFVSGNEIRKTLPSPGMTLRDYFAAKAMQAWAPKFDTCTSINLHDTKQLASIAYAIADAMIAARNKE